jgi:hypothetical protein
MLRFREFLPVIGWPVSRDPVAEIGGLWRWGRILLVAARAVWNAGIGGMRDSYPAVVGCRVIFLSYGLRILPF